jgi:hypothetical protein
MGDREPCLRIFALGCSLTLPVCSHKERQTAQFLYHSEKLQTQQSNVSFRYQLPPTI